MPKQKARELVRFGENVRHLRADCDWTQEQLAEKADLGVFRVGYESKTFQPFPTLQR